MKSKFLYPAILFAGFILVNIAFIQPFQPPQNKPIKEQTVKYTCPMHTKIVKDKPGNCPKCGMKLVEKKVKITEAARLFVADKVATLQKQNKTYQFQPPAFL